MHTEAGVVGKEAEQEEHQNGNDRRHREQIPRRTVAQAQGAEHGGPQQQRIEQRSADNRLLERLRERIAVECPRIAVDGLEMQRHPIVLHIEDEQRQHAEQHDRQRQPQFRVCPQRASARRRAEKAESRRDQDCGAIVTHPRTGEREAERDPRAGSIRARGDVEPIQRNDRAERQRRIGQRENSHRRQPAASPAPAIPTTHRLSRRTDASTCASPRRESARRAAETASACRTGHVRTTFRRRESAAPSPPGYR